MQVWPNFKSALPWDAAAVFTYFTISLVFWYLGVVPDLAAVRDRTPKRWQKIVYGVFALGWRGSAQHLRHYRIVYGLLAGLATPLVLSVHSVVSSDFAIAQLPGWHSTIFPPYFVAGAIFSGFAMVLTLMIPIRRIFGFDNVVTDRHIDNVCKLILVTGLIVAYSYFCEFFLAWYGGERNEMYTMFHGLPTGPNCWTFWLTMTCNVVVPQLFWFRWFRSHGLVAWTLSLLINVGMWCERFVIITMSLQRGDMPSMWHAYAPTIVDWGILLGSIGFFSLLFVLFLRWVPIIPTSEVRELNHELARERRREQRKAAA
jgi:Ni/Fe-hydrogenase subunit HybB-like protein